MTLTRISKTFAGLLAAICVLSACGGGGSGGGSTAPDLADAQGRWRGSVVMTADTQNASAVVLPDGDVWMVYQTSSGDRRLVQGALSVNGQQLSGSAKLFDLDIGSALGDLTLTAQARAGSSLSLNSSDAARVGNFSGTSFEALSTPAISLAGVWSDDINTPTVQWTIAGNGNLTGSGTGCTVSGSVVARADSARVADVQYVETCGGTVSNWSGVALNGDTANSLRFTLVKSDRSQALIVALIK